MFSEKTYKISKPIMGALTFTVLMGLMVIFGFSWGDRNSQSLEILLNSLSYSHTSRFEEIQSLLNFEDVENLSVRNKISYYGAQTRMYSMVLGDDAKSMEAFTDAMVWAERLNDNYSKAWLYADYAQIFIKNASLSPAIDCLKNSLMHASEINMEEQYYAYCYTSMAFAYSSMSKKNISVAKQYYEKANKYRDVSFFEDYPIDTFLDITLAQINLQEKDYSSCQDNLDKVKLYLDSCSFEPTNVDMYNVPQGPWSSRYLYPYYCTATILALQQGSIDDALQLMKEADDAFSNPYSKHNFTLNFFSAVFPQTALLTETNSESYKELMYYVESSIIRYSAFVESMESSAGESMYQVSESAINSIQEANHIVELYKIIIAIIIVSLLLLIIMAMGLILWHYRASLDVLTGTYNRGCFDRHLLKLRQKKKPFGIFIYDIDYFKQINDTYGHMLGDEVLKKAAAAVSSHIVHHQAALYRYGGDEFIVICKNCTPASLMALAQNCEKAVKDLKFDHDLKVTLSVGTAHTDLCENLLEKADANLYLAKKSGRACVYGDIV